MEEFEQEVQLKLAMMLENQKQIITHVLKLAALVPHDKEDSLEDAVDELIPKPLNTVLELEQLNSTLADPSKKTVRRAFVSVQSFHLM